MMEKKEGLIFIIDDNPEDRRTLREHLLKDLESSYRIVEEETGERTLALCKQVKPDCILLDYDLPDMNGLEFLAALEDGTGSMPYPVVILTSVSNEPIAIQALQQGAQDYMVKGKITTESLHRAIRNAIERVDMLRTLEAQRKVLELKNQELQAFAYALAHDLRAPLRAISGFAHIVHHDYQSVLDSEGQSYMDTIVKACSQMDHLIDDLLNYTRIEHKAVRYQPVALQSLVNQIIESMAEHINATSASVNIVDALPVVQGDRTLLSQIFINLLENALTYQREGVPPRITIDCQEEAHSYIIGVHDNGIGIAAKDHERIFTIFQRLHSDEEYAGTGIGLAIVKKSVDLMDGQVWVESAEGKGSTFYVRLPR